MDLDAYIIEPEPDSEESESEESADDELFPTISNRPDSRSTDREVNGEASRGHKPPKANPQLDEATMEEVTPHSSYGFINASKPPILRSERGVKWNRRITPTT